MTDDKKEVDTAKESKWLSPAQASRLLGVHPTTLRVWTRKGKLPAYRTAGGHRRFDEADVLHYLESSREEAVDSLNRVVENAMALTLRQASRQLQVTEKWYPCLDEGARSRHRELGRQLLGLTVQYVARNNSHERILGQGRQTAMEMAVCTAESGLSQADAIRAFVCFRDSLIDALIPALRSPGEMDADDLKIYRQAREFLNLALWAFLESYQGKTPEMMPE